MPRDYTIEIVGARRTEFSLLETEQQLGEELREASRQAGQLLQAAVEARAPKPRVGSGLKPGAGVVVRHDFPGGQRRLAGRAKGGATRISLTYQTTLALEPDHLAYLWERGTGLYGPYGSKYRITPIDPDVKALPIRDADGNPWRGKATKKYPQGRPQTHAASVAHPGIRPIHFFEDTVIEHADEVDALYDHAVARAVGGV